MSEANISVVGSRTLLSLLGARDQHLRQIRDALGVTISARNDQVHVEGSEPAVTRATRVLEQLKSVAERQGNISSDDVAVALDWVDGKGTPADAPTIEVMTAGRKVQPRTLGQARYVRAIMQHDVVVAVGPAGTGKTYLAVAMAVQALKQERVRKIVLVRPAVEAGESLGYLPGDMQAKINPYLRPLLDALREMIDYDQIKRLSELDAIELAPLAYMRGRTLNDAFIILDEAQNTSVSQMKMFLTRMGRGSKIIVSGDTTQIDLPHHVTSGLVDAQRRLQGIEGLAQITLSGADIVRHRLVHEIVHAYEDGARRH